MAPRRESLGVPVASGVAILIALTSVIGAAAEWLMPAELPDRQWLLAIVVVGGAIALVVHLAVAAAATRSLRLRVRRIEERARRLEAGDRIPPGEGGNEDRSDDELGDLGRAIDGASARAASSVRRLGDVANTLAEAAARAGDLVGSASGEAAPKTIEADAAFAAGAGFLTGLEEQARRATQVELIARSGAEVALRAAVGTHELAHATDEAERAVESAASEANEIARSLTDIALRAENVAAATASTSSAIAELNATIHRVRAAAESAAALGQQAGADAERGQGAIVDTLRGIDRIRETSLAIREGTILLERRAKEIGVVLELVGGLIERTNLLALNASIIAAQAGVEGRGFAVVAAEIKNLSHQTRASAGEIAALVAGVEEDAHAARRAAEIGTASVEEGRAQARSTAATLNEIFVRVRESARLSLAIATATEEQGSASSYVAGTMGEVTSSIEALAKAAAEQKQHGDALAGSTERLKVAAQTVTAAARIERDGAQSLASTLADLAALAHGLATAQRLHVDQGGRLHRALGHAHRGGDQLVALVAAINEVGSGARTLKEEADRLR